jgi:hypothetical protein
MFRPSAYPSFIYGDNPRGCKSFVPTYDLALSRMLQKFDGHYMKNGIKLFAVSNYRMHNHSTTPEMLDFFDHYSHEMSPLTLNDFRNMLTFKAYTGWSDTWWDEGDIESLYMEC